MINLTQLTSLDDIIFSLCDETGNVICSISESKREDIINAILKILSDNKVPGYFAKGILEEAQQKFDGKATISM